MSGRKFPLDKPIPADFQPWPLHPPEYHWEPGECACGASEEDCSGECGIPSLLVLEPPFDPMEDS